LLALIPNGKVFQPCSGYCTMSLSKRAWVEVVATSCPSPPKKSSFPSHPIQQIHKKTKKIHRFTVFRYPSAGQNHAVHGFVGTPKASMNGRITEADPVKRVCDRTPARKPETVR
jgi:hypothetical protein